MNHIDRVSYVYAGSVTVDTGQGLWLWRQNCSGSEHHLRSCDLGGLMSHDQAAESCDLVQLTNCSSGRAVALNCRGKSHSTVVLCI